MKQKYPTEVVCLIKKKLIDEVSEDFQKTVKEINPTIGKIFPIHNILMFFGRIKTAEQIEKEFYELKDI